MLLLLAKMLLGQLQKSAGKLLGKLFRIKVKSDSGQIWECDCAMIDVLFDLEPARYTENK